MRTFAATALAACAMAVGAAGVGCRDEGKDSAARAVEHATFLADLAAKDVAELERGMPAGAAKMADLWAAPSAEAPKDLQTVRQSLKALRRDVPDLMVAKSTFFALADADGMVLRNDLEQDLMAGKKATDPFPALVAATKPTTTTLVTTVGAFPGVVNDRDWLAAVPVKKGDKAVGVLLSGWTYRAFARHLKVALDLELQTRRTNGKDMPRAPLVYVTVFDATGAYGAPQTPPVIEKAIMDQGLTQKTGPVQIVLTLDGRTFGLGAVRVPKLAADAGIAVLRSEI
jgi:hypothetical protein